MDKEEIKQFLPHREPMLLVDEAEIDENGLAHCKYTIKEDIARTKKMGVPNLPSLYINGQLKFQSIIPSKEELEKAIREAM